MCQKSNLLDPDKFPVPTVTVSGYEQSRLLDLGDVALQNKAGWQTSRLVILLTRVMKISRRNLATYLTDPSVTG
jgi:hypothetical protein